MKQIALAGNPNCGKTTLFNLLTGLHQHVGNWPGKTVEKIEGPYVYKNEKYNIIDLPGTYSLSAYSVEEIVTRDYIIDENPEVVVNIVDASNIERNLYLTTQLLELGANVIVVLNMNKYAKRLGLKINEKKISELLGIPVIKAEVTKKEEIKKIFDVIARQSKIPKSSSEIIKYDHEINEHIQELIDIIEEKKITDFSSRWLALKLLENDKKIKEEVKDRTVHNTVRKIQKHIKKIYGQDAESVIADSRYGIVTGIIQESVKKPIEEVKTKSNRIDKYVLNKYLGIPIFFLIMYLTFQLTFTMADPFVGILETLVELFAQGVTALLANSPGWVISLISDGIIGGVGSVVVFLPNILFLFMIIALLEDSGYLARAAFVMDKVMNKIGLHGKSFISFVLGFGCNVPGIMAARTLENKRDRILTILLNPCMSCSARLPVYVLFVSIFFKENQGQVIFLLYLIGIMVAMIVGFIFKKFLLKGETPAFVMELPPYRRPKARGIVIHMWERVKLFIKKAGTLIFSAVIVIWFLSNLPLGVDYASENSYIGIIGKAISPVFEPLGFGFWQASASLLFGFVAKEIIVGSFGTIFGGELALTQGITELFTPLTSFTFMVFVLLYVPCAAVLAAIKKETNSWGWMLFAVFYLTAVAWIVSFLIYRVGLMMGY